MHTIDSSKWRHHHDYLGDFSAAERNTRRVIVFTAVMMLVEIVAGLKLRSMALFADGCHMSTHVVAFAIAAWAYAAARKNARNHAYSFGTGKIGILGAYTSAIILGGIAVFMAIESIQRLFEPLAIHYREATWVAVAGLVVNVVSAILLMDGHGHGHDHSHSHRHGEEGHDHSHGSGHSYDHDLNHRAAYVHVVADAITSVLAIIALVAGRFLGWGWLDPAMGVVGSAIIAQWAWSLIRQTQAILLDREPSTSDLNLQIRKAIESDGETVITDLHIWQLGMNKFAAIISLATHHPKPPDAYKDLLKEHEELVHATVEVHRCCGAERELAVGLEAR